MLNALLAGSKVLRDIWLGKWDSACCEERALGACMSFSHSQVCIHPGRVRLKSITYNPQRGQEKRSMIWISTVIVLVACTEAGGRAMQGWGPGPLHLSLCILRGCTLSWACPAGLGWGWQAWKASPHTGVFAGRKWQFVLAHQLLSEK